MKETQQKQQVTEIHPLDTGIHGTDLKLSVLAIFKTLGKFQQGTRNYKNYLEDLKKNQNKFIDVKNIKAEIKNS